MRADEALALLRPAVRAMEGYIPGEQLTGCIKLNTNECAWPPGPRVVEALARFGADRLRLYPSPRSDALRAKASEVYGLPAESILVGNGSDDLLTIVVRAFAGEGEVLAAPHPTYGLYDTLAALQGARMCHAPYGPRWELPEALGVDDERAPKLVFVSSPNNPSGTLSSRDEILALIARAPRSIVVVDEAYADFCGQTMIGDIASHPNLVVLRTFSKSYALAGLRLGLLFANPAIVSELTKVKDSYNVDALAQALGEAALDDSAYLRATVAQTLGERAWLEEALAKLGFAWPPSAANFLLVDVGSPELAASLYAGLRARKILVRHWDRPRLASSLRITVGTRPQNEALVAALGELVRSPPRP